MENFNEALSNVFKKAIIKAFSEVLDPQVEITQSTQEKFGHYQCNSAMKMAKIVGKNPREVAEKIISQIEEDSLIEKLEIAGPGFINITLKKAYLEKAVKEILNDPHLGINLPKRQRIIVDFSSPNVAKEMHVGHLRSTIIGDALANLFEFLGHDVVRVNHIGDWGTAFGMLITYLKEVAPHVLTGKEVTNSSHLVKWYKEAKKKFDEDLEFKKKSQLEVVNLQQGDREALKAWQIICSISEKEYQHVYDMLGIRITTKGESFYNPLLPQIVADLEKKGLVTVSDGAKCVFLEGFQNREGEALPLMVQKSDGGYNYDTTDMAAIYHRIVEEKGERLVYVTDAGQATHFEMVFKAAEKAKYLDPQKVIANHVPFGLVLGPDGKKFKTRSGDTEPLIGLINAGIQEAEKILTERSKELSANEIHELAYRLGIGAIKYADLSCHRMSDYVFSYERMLKFEGNTAAFLMYSYVRVNGIKRKINVNVESILKTTFVQLNHPSEVLLALHLIQFQEALFQMSKELLPHRLTDYLYGLAEKFNAFFRDCRVEGTEEQNSRLLLCEATAKTLKQGLSILGIQTVDRM